MNACGVSQLIKDELPALCAGSASPECGYALPRASLDLLTRCVGVLAVNRVFEFGSGQSTRTFLDAGCVVTAVEDSAKWLDNTVRSVDAAQRARFTPYVQRLQRVWLAGAPMRSWLFPEEILAALRDAELVLVDSPAWPPFREHALTLALAHCRDALVVVDDANIPTVARFCRRLANCNSRPYFQTSMDHGLFFLHAQAQVSLQVHRSLLETLKAWRRYFMAGPQ